MQSTQLYYSEQKLDEKQKEELNSIPLAYDIGTCISSRISFHFSLYTFLPAQAISVTRKNVTPTWSRWSSWQCYPSTATCLRYPETATCRLKPCCTYSVSSPWACSISTSTRLFGGFLTAMPTMPLWVCCAAGAFYSGSKNSVPKNILHVLL